MPASVALADSNPQALWDTYPLTPAGGKRAKVERAIRRQIPVADRGAGGTGFPVVPLLVIVGVGGAALAARRPRLVKTAPWPQEAASRWRSEIVWSSGYRTSRFRAVVMAPGRHRPRTLKRTGAYRWMLRWEPDPARAAFRIPFEQLIAELMDAGWQPTSPGPKWWSVRFVWNRPGAPV